MKEVAEIERPKCRSCRTRLAMRKGVTANGTPRYSGKCWSCAHPHKVGVSLSKRKELRDRFFRPCEHCGKEPKSISDFEIDHIDGDRNNNEISNLQSLCSDCHIAKTKECKDYLPRLQIFDETYRGIYKIPQGARLYSFTPFELIANAVTKFEPNATHCESRWVMDEAGIIGLKVIVWESQNKSEDSDN